MTAKEDLNDVDPDATLPGLPARNAARRRPVAWLSALLLLLLAALGMGWAGFDIESADARDGQSSARPAVVPVATNVSYLLDDAQREQPWRPAGECVLYRDLDGRHELAAPATRAADARRAGD